MTNRGVVALIMLVISGLGLVACSSPGAEQKTASPTARPTSSPAVTPDPTKTPGPTADPTITPSIPQADASATPVAESASSSPTPAPTQTATPTPEPTSTPTSTPQPPAPVSDLADGTVVLFFSVNVSDQSQILTGANWTSGGYSTVEIEANTKAVLRYLPETGDTFVFETYTSKSFAPNTRRAFTSNDRMFLATKWQGGGNVDFREYDPLTLERKGPVIAGTGDIDEENYVMAGNSLAYLVPAERDFFNKLIPGKIVKADTTTGALSEVTAVDSYLRLQAIGETVVAVNTPIFESVAGFTTYPGGAAPDGSSLTIDIDDNDFTRYSISDDGEVVWVGAAYGDFSTTIRLYRADLSNVGAGAEMIEIVTVAGTLLNDADTDDGLVALLLGTSGVAGNHRVLVYDMNTGDQSIYDTDMNAFDLQVMRIGE